MSYQHLLTETCRLNGGGITTLLLDLNSVALEHFLGIIPTKGDPRIVRRQLPNSSQIVRSSVRLAPSPNILTSSHGIVINPASLEMTLSYKLDVRSEQRIISSIFHLTNATLVVGLKRPIACSAVSILMFKLVLEMSQEEDALGRTKVNVTVSPSVSLVGGKQRRRMTSCDLQCQQGASSSNWDWDPKIEVDKRYTSKDICKGALCDSQGGNCCEDAGQATSSADPLGLSLVAGKNVQVTGCASHSLSFTVRSGELERTIGILPSSNYATRRTAPPPGTKILRTFVQLLPAPPAPLETYSKPPVDIRPTTLLHEVAYTEDKRVFQQIRTAILDVGLGGLLHLNLTSPVDCTQDISPTNLSFIIPGDDKVVDIVVDIVHASNKTGVALVRCNHDALDFLVSPFTLNQLGLFTPPLPTPLPKYSISINPSYKLHSSSLDFVTNPNQLLFSHMKILVDQGKPCVAGMYMEPLSDVLVVKFDEKIAAEILLSGSTMEDGLSTLIYGVHLSASIDSGTGADVSV
jgi:hypothetical protein